MSTDSKGGWSRQVGFRLETEEKRQKLEEIRVRRGYSNLAEFMRDLVDEEIAEFEAE